MSNFFDDLNRSSKYEQDRENRRRIDKKGSQLMNRNRKEYQISVKNQFRSILLNKGFSETIIPANYSSIYYDKTIYKTPDETEVAFMNLPTKSYSRMAIF